MILCKLDLKIKTVLLMKNIPQGIWLLLIGLFFIGCNKTNEEEEILEITEEFKVYGPYKVIKLPVQKGVRILNPTFISLGPNGWIFSANQSGEIYTLQDSDGDGLEDEALLFFNINDLGLRSPSGFAFSGDTVYIGTSQEIRAFIDFDNDGKADSTWTVFNEIPYSHHPYEWTPGLSFGSDGWLYFNLTTDSWNAGASPDPRGYRGSILKIKTDGKKVEQLATGIRSIHGMAFHSNGDLFFADNEGGGNSSEELNVLEKGAFYGHNPRKYNSPENVKGPVYDLKTEVAPSGIVFNKNDNDFGGTGGDLFVAYYGPGERWNRGGVGRVRITRDGDGNYQFEEYPVLDIPKLSDLVFSDKGELYLAQHGKSDYWYNPTQEKSGMFFKVVYDPNVNYLNTKSRPNQEEIFSNSSIESGKQLFAELACLACHSMDGSTELLGPNLKDVGNRFSREELIEEIAYPSKIIKPSMTGLKVIKKDGQVLLGRPVSIDENEISLMLVGNYIVSIAKADIDKTEPMEKSLMYEGLLQGVSEEEMNNLLDYIISMKDIGF
jgi:putative heme-binding domain-containing protein